MKKITFKITAFLMLVMFAFQAQAQIVAGQKYTMQNAATGDYISSDDSGVYALIAGADFAAQAAAGNVGLNFNFQHHDTVDPNDGTVHNYPDDWNILNDFRGAMRGAGNTEMTHTNFKHNIFNGNGAHKTDKRWVVETRDLGFGLEYRFAIISSIGDDKTPRYLYQAAEEGNRGFFYNDEAANITGDGGEERTWWILAESTIEAPLSTDSFDASSIFISNPVNNELNIKGFTDNVSKVSVYNLLGSSVLTRSVEGQSSISLNVSALAAGMYIVKLEGDNGTFSKKIIKQ